MFTKAWLSAALLLSALVFAARAESNAVVNLSHYDQATPDFAAMKRAGIVGVIHEATYPPGVPDALYASRQVAATRAGLLWGAYHFANGSDPVRQADFFLSVTGRNPPPGGTLLVLDFETNTHYPGGTMSVAQALKFADRVRERTGRSPGLYSNEHRVQAVLNGPSVTPAMRSQLRNCWLWIANYHYIPRTVLPFSHWTMWQYTGDGTCDLPRARYPINCANVRNAERNIFEGSRGELVSFWQSHAWSGGR